MTDCEKLKAIEEVCKDLWRHSSTYSLERIYKILKGEQL
jgi:hypothetical protein